jgi:hypothetical protein
VFALLRKRDENRGWFPFFVGEATGTPPGATDKLEEMREGFRKLAAKYGWSWDRSRAHNWGREKEVLEACPPDELSVISEVTVTETLEERVDRIRKGAFGFTSTMPVAMREEIIAAMRERTPETRTRQEVYQLACWRRRAKRK